MNGINTEWVCVHWSKAGKEVESVLIFATEAEAEDEAEWIRTGWYDAKGNFSADPRVDTTVMPRSDWEVC